MPKKVTNPESKPASRTLPEKCRRCAMLSAEQAKALHGAEGDGCWNPTVCYSRRSYARHRDRRNQNRSQRRQDSIEQIVVETDAVINAYSAVLLVYRSPGADTPVHAIGAEIWQGQSKAAIVQPIHCSGLVPSQVHAYVSRVLAVLEQQYGIRKFASQTRLDPELCPIRPCPHLPPGLV